MSEKQYAERDAMALDEAGGYYMRHLMAMTGEKLHSKGDIAAELGWRDMQIAALQQKLDALLGGFEEAIRHKDKLAAELNALAAENASIKASVEMHAAGFKICPACSHQDECETDDVVWMVRETPATDAYLNSVRADAIVESASRIAAQVWEEGEGAGMVAAIGALEIIERELRAGQDGE